MRVITVPYWKEYRRCASCASYTLGIMQSKGNFSIGLDLGGTNLRAAAVDRSGKLLDSVSGATARSDGREAILSEMTDAIVTLRERWGAKELAGIGVAVPGFILLKEGVIRNSNNLASLEDFPIRDEISRRIGAYLSFSRTTRMPRGWAKNGSAPDAR